MSRKKLIVAPSHSLLLAPQFLADSPTPWRTVTALPPDVVADQPRRVGCLGLRDASAIGHKGQARLAEDAPLYCVAGALSRRLEELIGHLVALDALVCWRPPGGDAVVADELPRHLDCLDRESLA